MGYHVTILRTRNGIERPFTTAEVASALARMDSPYVLAPDARADARLIDPSQGDDGELMFLQVGELWASNPSERLLAVMIDLASQLDARVRGDEFETYRTVDETYTHPDDVEEIRRQHLLRESAGRRRTVHALIPIGAGALLGCLVLMLKKLGS